MNLTTADRPIDSVRNVSFQGIGGDVVTFAYPDLYQVSVYKTVGNKLVLKSPNEILAAIKVYLQDKVTDYNAQLTGQRNTRTQYYNAHTDAFNFLATTDPQATPNRNYNLLPQDFFITQLTTSLDNLVSLYGAKYIYGNTLPSSSDEKLLLIAKLLYQQNIARPEKGIKTDVNDDIAEAQNTFNVNQKISDTTDTYLQSDNNQ